MRRIWAWVAVSGAMAMSWPSPTQAQRSDEERAQAHFASATAYYEESRYDEAAREFMESYRLSGHAVLLINASRSYERALRFDDAVRVLEEYLRVRPDAPDRRTQEVRVERLRELAARQRAGDEVEAPAEEAPIVAPEDTPAPTAEPAADAPADAPAAAPPPDSGPSGLAIGGLIIGGVGLASGGVALALGLVAHDTYNELDATCAPDGACPSGSQPQIDEGRTLSVTSTVLTGVATVALIAGVVMAIAGFSESGGERAAVVPIVGPEVAGLAVVGSL